MPATFTTITPALPAATPAHATNTAWALTSLSLATLLSSLGTSIANVALPALAQSFTAPFQSVQWVVLTYLVAITTLTVGAGRLGDLFGHRRTLLAGMALFTSGSVLCGLAPTLPLLLAARVLQGIGAAAMLALSLGMIGALVPKDRIGRAMGLLGTMSAIGTALGPSLAGVLLAGPGWRAIFLAPVPLAIAGFAIARRHLPAEQPRPAGRTNGFDPAGTALLVVTLSAYALALTLGRGHFGTANAGLLALALVAAVAFVAVERTAAAPIIHLDLFRQRGLPGALAATTLVAAVLMATLVVGPFHLSRALGLGSAGVGFAMMSGPVVAALAGIPAGRLVDRWGPASAGVVGLAGVAAGSTALASLPLVCGIFGYVAGIVAITASYALFQAANNTTVMARGAPDQRGTLSGLLNLARNLGLITGASAMGAVFMFATEATDIASASPAAVAAGTRATFLLGAGLAVLALVFARPRGSKVRPAEICRRGESA